MNPSPHTPDDKAARIDQQAARWLTRRDEGLSPVEATAFAQWRDADPRHASAVSRLEFTQSLLRRLPESTARDLHHEVAALLQSKPRPSRTLYWFGGLAAAAALVFLAAVHLQTPRGAAAPSSYVTAADSRQVDLSDGSTVLLSAASQLDVRYSPAERALELTSGEAHFEVKSDPNRPFLVTAGNLTIRAVGTAFKVRHHDPRTLEVAVTEGRVQLVPLPAAPAVPPGAQLLLGAGESLVWDRQRGLNLSRLAAPATAAVAGAGPAATAPRITFWDTSLAQAVAEFNRYSPVQLELADESLAQRAIDGSFSGDSAESFATVLSKSGEIQLERPSPDRIILRPAP